MSAAEEIYKQHSDSQSRFAYFLLGAAGSAVAFAVHQTKDDALSLLHIPLGVAVVAWSASFMLGLRYLGYRQVLMSANLEMLKLQDGTHHLGPQGVVVPEYVEIARKACDEINEKAGARARWQQRFLVVGALAFIAGHVLEMAGRAQLL